MALDSSPGNPASQGNQSAPTRQVGLLDVLTPRRLITTALLVLVALLVVVGFQSVRDQRTEICGGGALVKLFPCPGDTDLRQGRIGVSLTQGYKAEIYVDTIPIPKDQVTVEGSDFYFTPGTGTETGNLAPGRHTARVVYYRELDDPSKGQEFSWSFTTH
ncbi:MAG: hypothetical protein NVS3B21_20780 [Acidimicrobiales bacterium]